MGYVPLAYAVGALTIWQLFVVALLSGVLTVFFDVSSPTYLPPLVGRHRVVEGHARLAITDEVARLSGRPLGGWLVQAFGAPFAVAADAVSFVLSAVPVTTIRTGEPSPERPERRHLGRETPEGLRFVSGQRLLRAIAACSWSAPPSSRCSWPARSAYPPGSSGRCWPQRASAACSVRGWPRRSRGGSDQRGRSGWPPWSPGLPCCCGRWPPPAGG